MNLSCRCPACYKYMGCTTRTAIGAVRECADTVIRLLERPNDLRAQRRIPEEVQDAFDLATVVYHRTTHN